MKRKRIKPEDFIGWKSEDGNLEVVGIHGKLGRDILFKVECKICSKDKELFPEEYFISRKGDLLRGQKPCGCGRNPQWDKEQFLIRAKRKLGNKDTVQNYAEEFHGAKTRLDCTCNICGNKWNPTLSKVINASQACPICGKANAVSKVRKSEESVIDILSDSCNKKGHVFIGMVGKYKNGKSRFEYCCPIHGIKNTTYDIFIRFDCGCPDCNGGIKLKEEQALEFCSKICKEHEYKPVGFEDGYKNNKSYFTYICKNHGKQKVRYSKFVDKKTLCPECNKYLSKCHGYYDKYKDPNDTLYVININNKYIKIGRSFDIESRISSIKYESGETDIELLATKKGKHSDIFKAEQYIHKKLKNFIYDSGWTKETYNLSVLSILDSLIEEAYNDFC